MSYVDTLHDVVNEISGRHRSEMALALEDLTQQITVLRSEIHLLRKEVLQMSDANTTLDQAVADLSAASTSKIAEDQALVAEAKVGQNVAADVAKVEGIVGNLNAETAAEQAVTNPPAPVTPTPAVPVVTPAGQINPIPTATVTQS